ncbi:hypothetical protein ERO13_D13G206166v2 [Gossypium hirsutum]|uniref:Uncharacterized protein n=1 Tax=Gossypium raimondii TaxID=29730 RepID=A0A0D2VFB9_GOSRA|nr:hypothetical protein ERO13_D13G206166v2 [Gossypium hirsutum]KJB82156.1 hypothetical protein B456_013G235000 [Gossypium raimondii]
MKLQFKKAVEEYEESHVFCSFFSFSSYRYQPFSAKEEKKGKTLKLHRQPWLQNPKGQKERERNGKKGEFSFHRVV